MMEKNSKTDQSSLHTLLEQEIRSLEKLRNALGAEYDKLGYEKLEKDLTDRRNYLKEKLRNVTDPDQEYLSRSELRKALAEEAIRKYTEAAEIFQEARENSRLDHPKTTDVLEDLSHSLKSLQHLVSSANRPAGDQTTSPPPPPRPPQKK